MAIQFAQQTLKIILRGETDTTITTLEWSPEAWRDLAYLHGIDAEEEACKITAEKLIQLVSSDAGKKALVKALGALLHKPDLDIKVTRIFNSVYDTLVSLGGANADDRIRFMNYHVEHHHPHGNSCGMSSEWRFQGHFGAGGKFFVSIDGFRIDCYSEDRTDDLVVRLVRINEALKPIYEEWKKLWEQENK